VAKLEKVNAEPLDVVELQQTIRTLQTELTRSAVTIQELVKTKSDSRDVIEKLQADLLRSADQVIDLEKAKTKLELSAKQAEQARDTAENDKHQTEQVSNEKSTKLQMAYAQLQTDKAAVDAKSRAWQFLAYVAIACFVTFVIGFGWSLRRI